MRTDPEAPKIDMSEEELSKILQVVPRADSLDREAFHSRLIKCIRGFAVVEKWEKIVPWRQADVKDLKRMRKAAAELEDACRKSGEPAKYLLDHICKPPPLSALDMLEFSKASNEYLTLAIKYAPLPDEGSRRDLRTRFLFIELVEIWELFTGEEAKRSDRRRASGSPVGEFGLMTLMILEFMCTTGVVSEDEIAKLQKAILSRLDRSKSNRLL